MGIVILVSPGEVFEGIPPNIQDWFLVNVNLTGFYRVLYNFNNYMQLCDALDANINVCNTLEFYNLSSIYTWLYASYYCKFCIFFYLKWFQILIYKMYIIPMPNLLPTCLNPYPPCLNPIPGMLKPTPEICKPVQDMFKNHIRYVKTPTLSHWNPLTTFYCLHFVFTFSTFLIVPGLRAASTWRTLGIRPCRTFCSDLAW